MNTLMTSIWEPHEAWFRMPKRSVAKMSALPSRVQLGAASKYPELVMLVSSPVATLRMATSVYGSCWRSTISRAIHFESGLQR